VVDVSKAFQVEIISVVGFWTHFFYNCVKVRCQVDTKKIARNIQPKTREHKFLMVETSMDKRKLL
jgi:hypothetical protein